ncbi:MAG: HAMP domain-containing histidine kinase, partial [Oscillospiraceae bacterium]|nr:HAMP domain-containing histidine kinase [Oscillospiraceae bacterium]
MDRTSDKEIPRMFSNLSAAMIKVLNDSMAASEIMAKKLEREEDKELEAYLAVIRRDQMRLLRIADNLGELGRMGLDEKLAEPQSIELGELCEDLVGSVSALIGEKETKLSFSGPAEAVFIKADGRDIEKMLLNVLANSLLHCPKGGRVELGLTRNGETAVISVSDTGTGIAENVLPTLFGDFVREADLSDPGRGAGLGLGTAEGLAALYGGGMVTAEREGGGVKTVISLPCSAKSPIAQTRRTYSGRM